MRLSILALQVKGVYSKLLETRADRWNAQKVALKGSIQELAHFISALASLPQPSAGTRTAPIDAPDFSSWFEHLHQQVCLFERKYLSGLERSSEAGL